MSYICGITFSKWVIQSAAAAIDSEPPEDFYVWSTTELEVAVAFQFILDFKMHTYVFSKLFTI